MTDQDLLTFSVLGTEFPLPLLTITSPGSPWSLPREIPAVIPVFAGPLLNNTHFLDLGHEQFCAGVA